jgi:hypothetical protein
VFPTYRDHGVSTLRGEGEPVLDAAARARRAGRLRIGQQYPGRTTQADDSQLDDR